MVSSRGCPVEKWNWKAYFLLVGEELGGSGLVCVWPWVVKATRRVFMMGTISLGGRQTGHCLPALRGRQSCHQGHKWSQSVCRPGVCGKGWSVADPSMCGGASASVISSAARTLF